MNICILGPVFTDKYFGGVATFTESLADAFNISGHNATIITDYTIKEKTIRGSDIIGVFKRPSRKNIFMPRKIADEVLNRNPDIVISSLEYGLTNRWLKKKKYRGKTVFYLHGFPVYKENKAHSYLVKIVTQYISKCSDYVISNSELTAMINEEINGIKSDAVINVCLGYDFIDEITSNVDVIDKKKGNIIYIGRLVKEKNIDKIIHAFNKLDNEATLTIIGDGPEKDCLKELVAKMEKNIEIVGKVSPREVVKYYMEADIFISLCQHESFGIVYLEALAANCKIICPKTGGQLDLVLDFLDRVSLVSIVKEDDITKALKDNLSNEIKHFSNSEIANRFSYVSLVKGMESFFNHTVNLKG